MFMKRTVLGLALAMAVGGCGQSEEDRLREENDELRDQVSSLQSDIEDAQLKASQVQDDAEQLRSASSDLQGEVGRLQSENWRDVVPGIEGASDDVDSARAALDDSAGDLDTGR